MTSSERPLDGRTIIVTRPERQAAPLAGMIEAAGGTALRFPMIEIESASGAALDAAIESLDRADLAIFISRNAAELGLERVRSTREWPVGLPAAAIGAGTRRALQALGLQDVFSPEGAADSEALLAHPRLTGVSGKRIVVFRGEGGREVLAARLRERGAQVEYAECYRRRAPCGDPRALIASLADGRVDALVVSSGEGLRNLLAILGDAGMPDLSAVRLFVAHRRIAEQAAALPVASVVVAGPGDDDMFAALVAHFRSAG